MKGLFACLAVFVFFGCVSVDKAGEFRNLDLAIEQSCQNIHRDFNESASIAVFNITSSSSRLSEYIIEEVMNNFTNMHKYNIVERSRISAIFQEYNFQFSGNVSDDTIQRLGNMLGAQFVVTGSLDDVGSYYRLRLFVIAIESGERKSSTAVNIIKSNEQVAFLLNGQQNHNTNTVSPPAVNLIGTTWSVIADGDNMGIFIFDTDNVVRTNIFGSYDGVEYTKGIWNWTPDGRKLIVRIMETDSEEWRFEFDTITNLKSSGIVYEDEDVLGKTEINKVR